jgi:hypothetical protein
VKIQKLDIWLQYPSEYRTVRISEVYCTGKKWHTVNWMVWPFDFQKIRLNGVSKSGLEIEACPNFRTSFWRACAFGSKCLNRNSRHGLILDFSCDLNTGLVQY